MMIAVGMFVMLVNLTIIDWDDDSDCDGFMQ